MSSRLPFAFFVLYLAENQHKHEVIILDSSALNLGDVLAVPSSRATIESTIADILTSLTQEKPLSLTEYLDLNSRSLVTDKKVFVPSRAGIYSYMPTPYEKQRDTPPLYDKHKQKSYAQKFIPCVFPRIRR